MNAYLVLILVFLLGTWLLDLLENLLNVAHLCTELPEEFRDLYDADRYRRADLLAHHEGARGADVLELSGSGRRFR